MLEKAIANSLWGRRELKKLGLTTPMESVQAVARQYEDTGTIYSTYAGEAAVVANLTAMKIRELLADGTGRLQWILKQYEGLEHVSEQLEDEARGAKHDIEQLLVTLDHVARILARILVSDEYAIGGELRFQLGQCFTDLGQIYQQTTGQYMEWWRDDV
jgi:hypothetical protein